MAQTRVSGLLTNAPYMLNVDCDMFANNPRIALHALCLLLGTKMEAESAYVQFPQKFYDGLEDDPFGNQMVVLQEVWGKLSFSFFFPHCCADICHNYVIFIYDYVLRLS